jgi:hypothetical protein
MKKHLLSLALFVVGCGVTREEGSELRWAEATPAGRLAVPTEVGARRPHLASTTRRLATRCPTGTVSPETLTTANSASRPAGLFTAVRDATTLRSWLHRLEGTGCGLTAELEFTYATVEVADGLISAGANDVYVSQSSSIQQVNHRRCGERTLSPFRSIGQMAVAPSEQRMVISNCGSWFAMKLEADGWVHDPEFSLVVQSMNAPVRQVFLDDATLASIDAAGALTVKTATTSVTFDTNLDGAAARPDTLEACGHGVLCLAYPDADLIARWSDTGTLLDVVTVEGLAEGEHLVRAAQAWQGPGTYVLISGPAGASLAFAAN